MTRSRKASQLAAARKLVNGGSHGLESFKSVFALAAEVWPLETTAPVGATRGGSKTSRRPAESMHKVSRTKKDTADLRDRLYVPPAISLPDEYPRQEDISKFLPAYTQAKT